MPDLAAINFFPENFIFLAVEALRLCKTFSRDPPHALSKPSSCSLKTLLMLSCNPPPNCVSYSQTLLLMGTGRTCCRSYNTNFSEKRIIVAISGSPRPSSKINLCVTRNLPLRGIKGRLQKKLVEFSTKGLPPSLPLLGKIIFFRMKFSTKFIIALKWSTGCETTSVWYGTFSC